MIHDCSRSYLCQAIDFVLISAVELNDVEPSDDDESEPCARDGEEGSSSRKMKYSSRRAAVNKPCARKTKSDRREVGDDIDEPCTSDHEDESSAGDGEGESCPVDDGTVSSVRNMKYPSRRAAVNKDKPCTRKRTRDRHEVGDDIDEPCTSDHDDESSSGDGEGESCPSDNEADSSTRNVKHRNRRAAVTEGKPCARKRKSDHRGQKQPGKCDGHS